MNENPVLSVIVPVYNGAQFLSQVVEHIRQECPRETEIILVDDGSTDESLAIARKLGEIQIVSQENSGPAAARNAGLKVAKGDIIAFLDVDDVWPKSSLQQRFDNLRNNAANEIVLGHLRCLRVLESGEEELSEPFVSFNLGAALYRRTVFEKVGMFDAALRFGEDTDWFLRAREAKATISVIKPVTLHYRLHQSGMTHGKSAADLNVVRVLKRSLDRRRKLTNDETKAEIPQDLPAMTREES